MLGEVQIERPYYYCKPCQAGHSPRDAAMRLGSGTLSPGATRLVTLAGTVSSFAEAATKALPELSGLRLGASTVERTTERVGAELGEKLAEGSVFGDSKPWEWTKDAEGKTCAYIAADSTGVGMQGPKGAKAEGRMAAVAMIWNAAEGKKGGEVRYVSGITGGLAALGEPLRKQGGQVGMDGAERWVAISDGGIGIEDWIRVNFPRVEAVILDFYHASEYLHEWSKACHPHDESAAGTLADTLCHRLKHEGGQAVLDLLRIEGGVGAVREKVLGYFENQVHRMDYPSYLAKGWVIGSGSVEAACKQVVNARLKGTGMRWGEPGADAVCHLRALFRSEKCQWDAFWTALAG